MRVAFLTLGCKVNYYETGQMIRRCREYGFEIREFSEEADIYIVNTCTVTNIADRKSRQMLHRAKKKNPEALVVAVGCYAESGGEKLKEDPVVDLIFSNAEKETLPGFLSEQYLRGRIRKTTHVESSKNERTRAYLKVQDGCNQFCSYCLIPYVRGRGKLKSTPEENVLQEVCELADRGYKEVVLTGIHLSSYGVDFTEARNFVELKGQPLLHLIQTVAEVPGIERVRLGSLEPRIISENFLQELAKIPQFCPHFHLSLQSGSKEVLKRMNRHYTPEEYRQKVEKIRAIFENPAITTDVIVGFPGETRQEFEETRNFLREIELSDIHVFSYSPRSGTQAAGRKEQISPEVKKERSECLLADTQTYREAYGRKFIGKEQRVLFEDTVVESGITYLCGHNERYVKIGITEEKAKKNGFVPGVIGTVLAEKIFWGDNG